MLDLDRWQEVWTTLRKNRLRTFLTAFGVFWGILSIVAMLGFGRGFQNGVRDSMSGFASNAVYVWGQRTSLPYKGLQPGRSIRYQNSDIEALLTEVDEIRYLAPRNWLGGFRAGSMVVRNDKSGTYEVGGHYPDFAKIQPMLPTHGRFINPLDLEEERKVAVIGSGVLEELYEPGEDPIGTSIRVRGVYFQVIGAFKTRQTGGFGDRIARSVYIPFTTFQRAFNYGDRVGSFAIVAKPSSSATEVEKKVVKVLSERHRVNPKDTQAVRSWNTGKQWDKQVKLFAIINIVLWTVGILTLLAGVFGVANIMLISVKERTKEFGVRKAVGARPWTIVAMVVQECVTLTSLAGYTGLVAGIGFLELFELAIDTDTDARGGRRRGPLSMLGNMEIDFDIAMTSLIVLIIAGLLAAIIPALHAARISPVEALRAE